MLLLLRCIPASIYSIHIYTSTGHIFSFNFTVIAYLIYRTATVVSIHRIVPSLIFIILTLFLESLKRIRIGDIDIRKVISVDRNFFF